MSDDYLTSELTTLLKEFYVIYNPLKIDEIDNILEGYEGRIGTLLQNIKLKYKLVSYSPFDAYIFKLHESNVVRGSPEHTGRRHLYTRNYATTSTNITLLPKNNDLDEDLIPCKICQRMETHCANQEKYWSKHYSLLQKTLSDRDEYIEQLEQRINGLSDALSQTKENKAAFCRIYTDTIQKILAEHSEHTLRTAETMLMQHEELLSQEINNNTLQYELGIIKSVEDKRELQRLRFELISAMQRESELRSDVRFLQAQLYIAAETVSAARRGKQSYWDDFCCV